MIATCPHCMTAVLPTADNHCPSCLKDMAEIPEIPKRIVFFHTGVKASNLPGRCAVCGFAGPLVTRVIKHQNRSNPPKLRWIAMIKIPLLIFMMLSLGAWGLLGMLIITLMVSGVYFGYWMGIKRIVVELPLCYGCATSGKFTSSHIDVKSGTVEMAVHETFAQEMTEGAGRRQH